MKNKNLFLKGTKTKIPGKFIILKQTRREFLR